MALFRRKTPRPADYGGDNPLEVKGEASYQAALARIAGPKVEGGFDLPVVAVLTPDPTNVYDANAVRVTVGGQLVGFVNRDDAPRIQKIVQRLEGKEGRPIAVHGRIVGGWDRGDGDTGHYGIWLYYDKDRFR